MLPDRIERHLPSQTFPNFPSTSTQLARAEGRSFFTQGHLVIDWIETYCVLTAADFVGKPFKLLPWQKQLLLELFEVVPTDELDRFPSGWKRKHRWALIGIPKKNGKTELAAALALYFLLADDEGAPVICCAAASDEQADLLFGAATKMCDMSPRLAAVTERQTRTITVVGKIGAELRRVAAAAGTNDGKNIHVNMLDELHEWPRGRGDNVFDVLTNGVGARKQPMNIMITTAGSDEDSRCYEMYEYGLKLREGSQDDEAFYFYWIEPCDDNGRPVGTEVSHTDLEWTERANPSWGLILHRDFYVDMLTKKPESVYRRYFMNQWTEAEEIWEAALLWDGLQSPQVRTDDDRPLYVGIDVGRRHDTSAVCWVQMIDDTVCVHQRIWENPHRKGSREYDAYRMNLEELENLLLELYEVFQQPAGQDEDENWLPGPLFAYDPHFFARSAVALEGQGLHMVEFPQTDARMIPASQRLFEVIKIGQLEHDGDPMLRRHIRSVIAKEKERGWRISRPVGSRKRIDGAVALAEAVYIATQAHETSDQIPEVW